MGNTTGVAQHTVMLQPEGVTPVLNRVMGMMLGREFQRPVEPDLYFAARNILLR